MTRTERARELARRFPKIYPDAHCELDFRSPLDLLVATMLSAQCTDKRVNIVTKDLFRRCKSTRDYAEISQEELEGIVRSTGFYRNKAKNIRAMAAKLIAEHDGSVPRSLDALAALPGVGRKTGNVVLGNAFGIEEGVVVDTHVSRVSSRLGLTKHVDPPKIESDLMKLFPGDQWTLLSHWLIWHGRRRCFGRKPDCSHCELFDLCPTGVKLLGKSPSPD
ncbi:MAG: endonuclease III [Terrimicrobiaceae bacterium]